MQPLHNEVQATSNLGRPVVEQGTGNDSTGKGSRRVVRRPVPVLIPPMPLAPIAPAVVASAATPSPAHHQLQQPYPFRPPFVTAAHLPLHQTPHPRQQEQQQLLPASSHMPDMTAATTTLPVLQYVPTPLIFMNQKLRCGKWAAAEEAYALLLIEYFEMGMIGECENGTTLRSFLSRKLHCSPMRISKKYAGKGIGKKMFQSKVIGSSMNRCSIDPSEIAEATSKLQAAEAQFIASLFPGCNMVCVPFPLLPTGSSPTTGVPVPVPVHPVATREILHSNETQSCSTFPLCPEQMQKHPSATRSPPGKTQNLGAPEIQKYAAIAPRASLPPKVPQPPLPVSAKLVQLAAAAAACRGSSGETAPQVSPPLGKTIHEAIATSISQLPVADEAAVSHSIQLQQSYMNALRDIGENEVQRPRNLSNSPAAGSGSCHRVGYCQGSKISDTVESIKTSPGRDVNQNATSQVLDVPTTKDCPGQAKNLTGYPCDVHGFDNSPVVVTSAAKKGSGSSKVTTVLPVVKSDSRAQLDCDLPVDNSARSGIANSTRHSPTGCVTSRAKPGAAEPTSQAEMPDLLAGFDKMSQIVQLPSIHAPQTQVVGLAHQYSPAFTSRSFDDFHRFLGHEDLTPLSEVAPRPRGDSQSYPDARRSSPPVVQENYSATIVWQPPHDIPRISGEAELTVADAYAIFAQHSASFANGANEYSNDTPPIAPLAPSTEQLFYSDLSGMLVNSTGKRARGTVQNQEERDQKRQLYSLEQPLPKGDSRNFLGMKESTEGATGNSSMMAYSGGAVVSEASNSDSGSVRGSVTLGSDEDVSMV